MCLCFVHVAYGVAISVIIEITPNLEPIISTGVTK